MVANEILTNYYYFRIIAVVYLDSNPLGCIRVYLMYCNLHFTQFSYFIFYSLLLFKKKINFFFSKSLSVWDLTSPTKEPPSAVETQSHSCWTTRAITTGLHQGSLEQKIAAKPATPGSSSSHIKGIAVGRGAGQLREGSN